MDTKFIKLKKEYKNFIKSNIDQIKKLNIDSDLTKEKCESIYKLYNKIYKTSQIKKWIIHQFWSLKQLLALFRI
jgi:3-methyladenine DNA glycosylase AlkC